MMPSSIVNHRAALLMLAFLLGWMLFLRSPGFGVPLWNVDEGIHAAVARTLLDGGVLYRDAVDQRTPLTYQAVALVFWLFGENNLWALRAAVAVIIAVTAFGLFLLGRRAHSALAGAWAALVFCALTTSLFYAGDGNAANTEWFVILFTTWGTWWFWRTQARTDVWAAAGTGALFGLAFLSKQPALLDLAVPILSVGYAAATGRRHFPDAARSATGILAGFLAVIAISWSYYAARGVFGDMIFYTLAYNVNYYGPEVSAAKRLLTACVPFVLLFNRYPLVLLALIAATVLQLVRLVQLRPTTEERAGQPLSFYLLMWCVTSLAAAASGGRGFEHYYIQCLPPFALSAGWLLATAGSFVLLRLRGAVRPPLRAILATVPAVLLIGFTAWSILYRPVTARGRADYPHDPAMRASAFIKALTSSDERIFVWGYNPDIYLYTDRRPASRFVYCSFLTGLIPWTNLAPGVDTSYAIVPGAMNTLLAELDARRPAFIVDCSAGPHRNFSKYPLANYGPLQDFVSRHYVEAESGQFVPQGFRLHLIKDSARRKVVRLMGGAMTGRLAGPEIFCPALVEPAPTGILVGGMDPDGRLQRLELRADGEVIDSVSFMPTKAVTVRFEVPFERLGVGQHRLVAAATAASGETRESAAAIVMCDASAVPRDQMPAFALVHSIGPVVPLAVRAPFRPTAGWEEGHRVFTIHAPASITYPLVSGAVRVRGRFGIQAGAYAPANPTPTDGAEFLVTWLSPDGRREVLFHRLLQPRDHPGDRPMQFFEALIPAEVRGGNLEFGITPGPYGNNACDWTYWSDLEVETSR